MAAVMAGTCGALLSDLCKAINRVILDASTSHLIVNCIIQHDIEFYKEC